MSPRLLLKQISFWIVHVILLERNPGLDCARLPRGHAVVAQEMLAGAIDGRRQKLILESLIKPFEKRRRVVVPRFGTWKLAGVIMARLVQRKLMSPGGFAHSFVNDCLIAASCREEGLMLITSNREDFSLIRRVEVLEAVEPWPA